MKTFNTTGLCIPEQHYMVDISSRVAAIREMIDDGKYFTINRARQYGKTTTLRQLQHALEADYVVISLDFQEISAAAYATEPDFIHAFLRLIFDNRYLLTVLPEGIADQLSALHFNQSAKLDMLFSVLSDWCGKSKKPIVMLIDEVDTASNNQIFLDFLAQLRSSYLDRHNTPTFQSVILAGVTDIKNLRHKIRPDEAHRFNSPWNIAADFDVDMSFNVWDIRGMLREYEADHHTGMDAQDVAEVIEDYTSGYPFLVSRICQLLDRDKRLKWDREGVVEVVGRILMERNTLFDSLMGKVHDNAELRDMLWRMLFRGEAISYNPDDISIADAEMYGFVVNDTGMVRVANRIFESRLYNLFLFQAQKDPAWQAGADEKSSFIVNGRLDMDRVLERYVAVYGELFGDQTEKFPEHQGTLSFLLFIRPIINGVGHYYIEAQTRNRRRMDLVIDYKGEQFVVELKLWRGPQYHADGENQLCDYLEYLHLDKGYLLTYNFNERKATGLTRKTVRGKELVEAIV